MDITQIQTKSKEFTIAMIDANEQAFNAGVKAFNKLIYHTKQRHLSIINLAFLFNGKFQI